MNEKLTRANIINYLIAICVKNNIPPNNVRFAGLVRKVCGDKFGMDKYKAKSYIDTLISSWRLSRWKNWIQDSPYLTLEERERWFKQHGST